MLGATSASARQVDVVVPGLTVFFAPIVLPNGNLLLHDPFHDREGIPDVGAVFLLAPDGSLISTLRGSRAYDHIGSGGITVLGNGNYVILSPLWDSPTRVDAGAVTWCDGDTGLKEAISQDNSLVGSALIRQGYLGQVMQVGRDNFLVHSSSAVTWGSGTAGVFGEINSSNSLLPGPDNAFSPPIRLSNGHAVVATPLWDGSNTNDVGAVTWLSGNQPTTGFVAASNSLTGAQSQDEVGRGGVAALNNGNYVVLSPDWNDPETQIAAGAVTWGDGSVGTVGVVEPGNSLRGSHGGDINSAQVIELANGHYLVNTPYWHRSEQLPSAGAVTWASGVAPVTGRIGPDRSLVGSQAGDLIGRQVFPLPNGAFVVASTEWNNGGTQDAGAVTWSDGLTPVVGEVQSRNSLVGTGEGDRVGSIVEIGGGGNYLVGSPDWSTFRGAVTWGAARGGVNGAVSASNSLVGSTESDLIGERLVVLSNGHFVASSDNWSDGTISAVGAVTWIDAQLGATGLVNPLNSLIGVQTMDRISEGEGAVQPLVNGHYVVVSRFWQDGNANRVGAYTWRNGTQPATGVVNPLNSVVGSLTDGYLLPGQGDRPIRVLPLQNGHFVVQAVAFDGSPLTVTADLIVWGNGTQSTAGALTPDSVLYSRSARVLPLPNGNYLATSGFWPETNRGHITLADGSIGLAGQVSLANSVLGAADGDQVGTGETEATSDGKLVVRSGKSVTLMRASTGTRGPISSANSVLGTGNDNLVATYDSVSHRLFVVSTGDNILRIRSMDTVLALAADAPANDPGIHLTARLTGSLPTGGVAFTFGANQPIAGCGNVALTGRGDTRTASCITTALPPGTVSVRAAYGGDDNNDASETTLSVNAGPLFADGFE